MNWYRSVADRAEKIIKAIFLTAAYILGIGLTATIYKAMGKRIVVVPGPGSAWSDPSGSDNDGDMY